MRVSYLLMYPKKFILTRLSLSKRFSVLFFSLGKIPARKLFLKSVKTMFNIVSVTGSVLLERFSAKCFLKPSSFVLFCKTIIVVIESEKKNIQKTYCDDIILAAA